MRPQARSALGVAAARGDLLRCRSSPMDEPRHRRAVWHLAPRRSHRGASAFPYRLLALRCERGLYSDVNHAGSSMRLGKVEVASNQCDFVIVTHHERGG